MVAAAAAAAAVAGPVRLVLAVAATERGGGGNLPSLQFSAGMEMQEDRAADFFCFEQKWREWKEIEALEMLGESRNGGWVSGWAGRRERSSYERKASGGSADFGAFSSNPN